MKALYKMKTHEEAIRSIVDLEKQLDLYRYKVWGIPLWNVIRYKIRRQYLYKETGIDEKAPATSPKNIKRIIKYSCLSLKQFIHFTTKKHFIDNLIIGFSRLEKVGDFYIDKFVDPVIAQTDLQDNYIYIEYGKTGCHKLPRCHQKNIFYLDFFYLSFYILGIIISPFILLSNYNTIREFHRKIKTGIMKDKSCLRFILFALGEAFLQYHFFKFLLKKIHAKRIFGVSRILFFMPSLAAKGMNLPVYEFQHGITNGETCLYSGYYNPDIDPDYFLTFGDACHKNVFGIPENKIINIGWAFKSYLKQQHLNTEFFPDTFLVISEPEISQKVIDIVIYFANHFPEYKFHIRRHPQEKFTDKQKEMISGYANILDVSSPVNSNIAILSYDFIIGENSTVLYEALSIGKKVGRINFGGFVLRQYDPTQPDGFYYIHQVEDLKDFISTGSHADNAKKDIYSDFNVDLFNSFLS